MGAWLSRYKTRVLLYFVKAKVKLEMFSPHMWEEAFALDFSHLLTLFVCLFALIGCCVAAAEEEALEKKQCVLPSFLGSQSLEKHRLTSWTSAQQSRPRWGRGTFSLKWSANRTKAEKPQPLSTRWRAKRISLEKALKWLNAVVRI